MLEEHHRTGAVSVRGFYRRRARRLLPALFVLLLAVCSVAALFYREEMARLRAQVLSALTYSTNWYLIFSDGSYFDALGRPLALRHLWSLAVEEQFYLLWPLVMVFLLRRFRDRLGSIALIIGALAGASAVWMALLYEPGTDPSRLYYGTDTRLATLLMGGLLAIFWRPSALAHGTRAAARQGLRPGRPAGAGGHRVVLRQHLGHQRRAVPGRLRGAGRGVCPRRRRREPSGHRVRPGARCRGPHLDRRALLRLVPLALADLRGDPPGGRRAVRRRPAAGPAAGPDGAAGRSLLPAGGAADPPAGVGAMGPPRHPHRPAGAASAARARGARRDGGVARCRRGRGAGRPATDQRHRAEPAGRPAGDRRCPGHDRRADDEHRARQRGAHGGDATAVPDVLDRTSMREDVRATSRSASSTTVVPRAAATTAPATTVPATTAAPTTPPTTAPPTTPAPRPGRTDRGPG